MFFNTTGPRVEEVVKRYDNQGFRGTETSRADAFLTLHFGFLMTTGPTSKLAPLGPASATPKLGELTGVEYFESSRSWGTIGRSGPWGYVRRNAPRGAQHMRPAWSLGCSGSGKGMGVERLLDQLDTFPRDPPKEAPGFKLMGLLDWQLR